MPHLQFEINRKISDSQQKQIVNLLISEFSKIMKTGSDHIAVSLRYINRNSLKLGRAINNDKICIMNLDIRIGRTFKQKRALAISYMRIFNNILQIKQQNQYITFTEHKGEDFHLMEKSLIDWQENDDPLNQ